MPRGFIYIFSFFIALTSAEAFDPWPDQVRFVVEGYNNPISDKFLSTLHGTCNAEAESYRKMPVEVEDFRVRSDFHAQGELPVKLGLQRDSSGRLIKAPLVFVVPGAFNNLNHKQPRALMHQFSRLGHHVVVFPNPWGTQYISHNPDAPTGSYEEEGQAIYQAMRRVFQDLDEQGLIEREQVRVYGVSYGGFVAAMVGALDARHEQPIVSKDVTSVSPPFHIGRTLERLDDLISETRSYIALDYFRLIRRFLQVCSAADRVRLDDPRRLKDAKGLAASRGFHSELALSLKALDRVKGWDSIPGRAWNWLSPRYRYWYRTLNFKKYYAQRIDGGLPSAYLPEANLYYWIDQARAHGKKDVRVLVADDDFLNDYSWRSLEKNAGTETLMLHNGGHYGFRSLFWYRQFINQAYFRSLRADP